MIVGAGELVCQFWQLVARVGGVGEAFRRLGDLAREVWLRIGTLDPVDLSRTGNPFERAATAGGAAAADALSAALSRTYLEPPDLDLGTMAADARGRADGYREAASMLANPAGRPLASWQALKDAMTGTGAEAEAAPADAAGSAGALAAGLNDTAIAADGAGGAARNAGAAAARRP